MSILTTLSGADPMVLSRCPPAERALYACVGFCIALSSVAVICLAWYATSLLAGHGIWYMVFRATACIAIALMTLSWWYFLAVNWRLDVRNARDTASWFTPKHLSTYLVLFAWTILYAAWFTHLAELYAFHRPVDALIETLRMAGEEESARILYSLGFDPADHERILEAGLVTRLQITQQLLGPGAWLWHLLFGAIFCVPVLLIFLVKLMDDQQYMSGLRDKERQDIREAYNQMTEAVHVTLRERTGRDIPAYSRYADPPFNTHIQPNLR